MRLVWSPLAEADLADPYDRLVPFSATAAERLLRDVREVAHAVEKLPRAFRRLDGAGGEVRQALVRAQQLWLIYEVLEDQDEVLVLSVWPTRRHPAGWKP